MECLYYTDGIITNKKILSILCLLFDKVQTFYLLPNYFLNPLEERWQKQKDESFFSKSPCEKNLLTRIYHDNYNKFLRENKELIQSDVLHPLVINQTPPDWESFEANEKKLMEKGSGIAMGLWGQSVGIVPEDKIYVDAPWFSLYRWQGLSGALHLSIQTGQIPISDNYALSSLGIETVNRLSNLDHQPTREEIASHIAFKSLSLLLPNLPELSSEEILELRYKLVDELGYFRVEMSKIAKETDINEYNKLNSLVKEKIKPRIDDLKLKIESLNSELFRRIAKVFFIGSSATTLVSHFINLPLPAQIAAVASFAGKIAIDIHEHLSKRDEIKNESKNRGLVFLLELEKRFK